MKKDVVTNKKVEYTIPAQQNETQRIEGNIGSVVQRRNKSFARSNHLLGLFLLLVDKEVKEQNWNHSRYERKQTEQPQTKDRVNKYCAESAD